MVQCRYFGYSTTRLDELRKVNESLSFEYFVLNQEEAIKSIEDIDMDPDLLVKLLSDSRMSYENRNILFDVFGVEYMSQKLAERMNSLELEVTKDKFEAAWECLEGEDRKTLCFANLNLFTADDIQEYFPKLGEEYSPFANRQRALTIQIEYTLDNLKFAEYLKKIGYITSFTADETKERHETNHKVIKCKIKRIG